MRAADLFFLENSRLSEHNTAVYSIVAGIKFDGEKVPVSLVFCKYFLAERNVVRDERRRNHPLLVSPVKRILFAQTIYLFCTLYPFFYG